MLNKSRSRQQLITENEQLRAGLNEAEQTLRAIQHGEVDALVMSGTGGNHILTLKGALEPYRVMVETMAEAAVTLAEDGTVLYCNGRFADRVKLPLEQILRLPLQRLLARQDRNRFETMLGQAAKGEIREALTLQLADGSRIPALFSMTALPLSESKVISVIIADLSDVMAATEARSRLALIVESSDDAIISTTLDGVIESWNQSAEKLYGYTAGEALGQLLDALIIPPGRIKEAMHELEAIRLGEHTLLEDTMRLRKDGTLVAVSIKASPILDDAGKVVGCSINARDITERKRVEYERDRATHFLGERLKELNCLYAVSTILADGELPVEQCMQRIVETLPPTFQYPELTCARISLRGRQYRSGDFRETTWRLASAIVLEGEEDGELEVYYTEERPASDEGPFLLEERDLVKTVARNVGKFIRLQLATTQLQQFRDLLDASTDSVFVIDPGTALFKDVNERVSINLGYSRDELLRMETMDIDTAVPSKSAWDSNVKAMKKARTLLLEGEHRRKDGSTFPVEISVKYVSRQGNDYIVAIARDTTERKRAEAALRESERRFTDLLENVELVSMMLDREARITYCNDYLLRLSGWQREEVIGKNWWDHFVPPEIQDLRNAFFTSLLDNQPEAIHHENEILTRSGERRLIRWNNSVLRSPTGDVIGTASIGEDITERRKSEDELLESKNLLQIVVENVPARIFWKDRELRFLGGNTEFAKDAGLSNSSEFIGKTDFEMTWKDEAELYRNDDRAVMESGTSRLDFEEAQTGLDGDKNWLSISKVPLRNKDNQIFGVLGLYRDITERKQAEVSIKYLNRVLLMLSSINTLIVRVNDCDELFREACNIAVSAGGFRMAMLVIVDPVTMLPVSIISAGKDEKLLTEIKNIMSTSEGMEKTLIWQAIKKKKAVISNDTQNDPGLVFGNKYAEAGVKSMTVIPLIISGEALGILALYANEIEFFHEDEMKLLAELVDDIAFAIDYIDKQERLNYLAYYDVLTGLTNRSLFVERLTLHISDAINDDQKLAICLLDLERFKNFNDSFGREAGDVLLQKIAKWLTDFAHDPRLLARIDADHFVFVISAITSDDYLTKLIENFISSFLQHSFDVNQVSFRIGVKIGIAQFPDDGDNVDKLFRNAEVALKKAKVSGERYLFYKPEMNAATAEALMLENQLRQAIDNEEFVLHYQPKVNLLSGEITGAEALIRWNDPRTGLVPPGKFIPILEVTGLIYEVGRWALKTAIEDNLRWRYAGLPALRVAVNVSALQLRDANFVDEIRQLISVHELAASGLELEITESLVMDNVALSITSLQEIRALGVSISIDDFGTGFSSLSYLSKLPIDTLKIDRAFVLEMNTTAGVALVSNIIILAHALKLKVVAEGVETEKQSRQLLTLNCDEMQGFLFSKPVPADIFEATFLTPPSIAKT